MDGELSELPFAYITRKCASSFMSVPSVEPNSNVVRLGKFFVGIFLVLGIDHGDNTVAAEGVDLGVLKFAGRHLALEQYVQFSVCTALRFRQTEENPDDTEEASAAPEKA